MAFNVSQNGRRPPSCIFTNLHFSQTEGPMCVNLQTVIEIDQTVVEISRFFDFPFMAAVRPPSWIFETSKF